MIPVTENVIPLKEMMIPLKENRIPKEKKKIKIYPQAGCRWISRLAGWPSQECKALPGKMEEDEILKSRYLYN